MIDTQLEHVTCRWMDLATKRNLPFSMLFAGSVALHAINVFIAITMMPFVVHDIGGLDLYAWSSTVFVASSVVSATLASRLLGFAGIKGAYLFAVAFFAGGSTICAVAPDMWVLIAGRTIQGFGGGFFYALSYAVIRTVYPKPLWPLAIGLITIMWGVATLLGPAIGGVFAQLEAWRLAFWALLPCAAGIAALAMVSLPKARPQDVDRDPIPFVQIIILLLIVLTVSIGSVGTNAMKALVAIGVSCLLGAYLGRVDQQARAKLLPHGSFSFRSPLGRHFLYIALMILAMQGEVFVPFFLIELHAQPPLWAGYMGALMALGWTIGSILTANWVGAKVRRIIVGGPLICTASLLAQAVFLPMSSHGAWGILVPICLALLGVGFGIGVVWPHIVVRIYEVAPERDHDLAAGGVTLVQLFATALGAALAGMIANLADLSNTTSGSSLAALALCLSFAAFPLTCFWVARRI
ncbi:MFS transporter [Rhodobacteraceae bacterium B1Z28]|uniref:MFS transporter n=1 Tax=Ruegeria haliotis TaxID=2747601 RepID=A0ABX2PS01_9RHOB|nr:MFS transporter [Ruegeria haliotis]NVO56937.1 MFS transporter [Ruegeria haliotis]